jgi:hypothetical protein
VIATFWAAHTFTIRSTEITNGSFMVRVYRRVCARKIHNAVALNPKLRATAY